MNQVDTLHFLWLLTSANSDYCDDGESTYRYVMLVRATDPLEAKRIASSEHPGIEWVHKYVKTDGVYKPEVIVDGIVFDS